MNIALVYDETESLPATCRLPEDAGAEYEDPGTILGLEEAITAAGHRATRVPFGEDIAPRLRELAPDLVFNIAEGVRGPVRESLVPGWLDHLGVPYTGSDGLVLGLTLDKAWTKETARSLGIRTPEFRRVESLDDLRGLDLPLPLFVKPNAEGSSMGIRRRSRVDEPGQLEEQVAWVLNEYGQDCLVEAYCPGREYCVALLGNADPAVLPLAEIQCHGEFLSYGDKHDRRNSLVCPAAAVPEETAREMVEAARTLFRRLRCRDLARFDFKLDAEDRPCFIEVNPLPGLSSRHGIFARQALAGGMAYPALIGAIIDLAWRRHLGARRPASMRTGEEPPA